MLLAAVLGAEPPRLVVDAGRDTSNALGSQPYDFVAVGDRVLFVAQGEDGVRTLFATDASGSSLEPLLRPDCSATWYVASVRILAVQDESWALVGIDCPAGEPTPLWRTDGTRSGTARLAEVDGGLEGLPRVLRADDRLHFLEGDSLDGGQFTNTIALWSSDGTPAGTRQDVERTGLEEATTFGLTKVRDGFVFLRAPTASYGSLELWFTDGTDDGTRNVARFEAGDTYRRPVPAAGGRALFLLDNRWLWSTDGTPAGTFGLSNAAPDGPGQVRTGLQELGGRVYFVSGDPRNELWSTDGTPSGTVLEVALPEASILDSWQGPTVERLEGHLLVAMVSSDTGFPYLAAIDDDDPTRGEALGGFATGPDGHGWMARLGDRVLFPLRTEDGGIALGATGGSPGSTRTLADLCVGECPFSTRAPTKSPSGWLFVATDAAGGRRLLEVGPDFEPRWRSQLFDELEGFWGATPDAAELGGAVIFGARDARHGFEPFVSDPGSDAARLLADLRVDRPSSKIGNWMGDGDEAWFVADDVVWQTLRGASSARRLVETPRESCGIANPGAPAQLAAVDAGALASVGDCEEPAIWALDRISGSVTQLFGPERPDRWPGAEVLGSAAGRAVIAVGDLEGTRRELWRSDGTAAGTVRLAELEPGWGVVWPRYASLGGESWVPIYRPEGTTAWFALRGNGALERISDWQDAWTDLGGTASFRILSARTTGEPPSHLLYALRSSAEDAEVLGNQNVTRGVALGARWFGLFEAAGGVDVALLTDGTAGGTSELLPCAEGWRVQSSALAALGGRALYACVRSEGAVPAMELRASDGTPGGTRVLATADSRTLPRTAAQWHVAGSRAFLVGLADLANGEVDFDARQVWITDGTPGGTRSLGAFARGEGYDPPGAAMGIPSGLLLRSFDADHGRELWYVDAATATPRLVADLRPGSASSDPELLGVAGSNVYFVADDGLHGRELWVWDTTSAALCRDRERALCLQQGRFRVEAWWQDFEGNFDDALAVPLTADSGAFWFFDAANVELVSKVLDGRGVDGHYWVFYGALSNVSYAVTVTDGETGATRRYLNPPGQYASVGDTLAFGPLGASALPAPPPAEGVAATRGGTTRLAAVAASGGCVPGPTRLCLRDGRFAVEAAWRNFQGNVGVASATPWAGGETGTFWFFDAANVELIVKLLDGTPINGRYWVYYGALSNVEYTLTVTDTLTGAVRTYFNPAGTFASVGDVDAF